jgi:hypothetical protein
VKQRETKGEAVILRPPPIIRGLKPSLRWFQPRAHFAKASDFARGYVGQAESPSKKMAMTCRSSPFSIQHSNFSISASAKASARQTRISLRRS